MKSSKITESLFEAEKQQISSSKSLKSIVKICAAALCFWVALGALFLVEMDKTSAQFYACVLVAVVAVVVLLVQIFAGEKTYIFKPTMSLLTESVLFFENGTAERVAAALKENNLEQLRKLHSNAETTVRMLFLRSADGEFCRCQVQAYTMCVYEPVNKPIALDVATVKRMCEIFD